MAKTDLNQVYKTCYRASADHPALVQVPELNALVIGGEGRSDSPDFMDGVKVLAALAHTIKIQLRRLGTPSESVDMPLEVERTLDAETQRHTWHMLIVQPDDVTVEMMAQARDEIAGHHTPAVLARVRLRRRMEDTCVQMLHVGALAHSPETLAHIQSFGNARGLRLRPEAYEIYLNDPVTTRPENMRTILRAAVLSAR
jgi:hypothetical protein